MWLGKKETLGFAPQQIFFPRLLLWNKKWSGTQGAEGNKGHIKEHKNEELTYKSEVCSEVGGPTKDPKHRSPSQHPCVWGHLMDETKKL